MAGNPMADDLARQMARIMTGEVALPPPPQVDPAAQQRLRLQQKMYQDRQNQQMARIQAARDKAEQLEKERRRALDREQRERAEAFEEETRSAIRRDFLARGGRVEDFDSYWRLKKFDVFDELAKQHEAELLRKMPAYGAL